MTLEQIGGGKFSHDALGLAVAKTSYHAYSLREGLLLLESIGGSVQIIKLQVLACLLSLLMGGSLSFPLELGFYFSLQTIVVVAAVPLGIVTLGSLIKLILVVASCFASILDVPETMGLLWHNAIKKELNEIAMETGKIQHSGHFTNLSDFNESIAEERVIFPAIDGEFSFFQEHAEESQFNDFRSLIKSIPSDEATSSSEAEFYFKLCSHADHIMETMQRHFHSEEVQVT